MERLGAIMLFQLKSNNELFSIQTILKTFGRIKCCQAYKGLNFQRSGIEGISESQE